MSQARLLWLVMFVFIVLASVGVHAQPCRSAACLQFFPRDSGALNVRDYGAKGDGHTDDTAAIIAAVAASGGDTGWQMWQDQLVFFPAGTYIVSSTILKRYADGRFASGMELEGAGVDKTIIRLVDHAPGFDSPDAPRAVILTTSKKLDPANNRDYAHLGEGNDAYENFVEGMTVDVGHGNSGAIGIDYLANNMGAIRDVLIRAPEGSGATGLSMIRKLPGPALVQRVEVQGFEIGIDFSGSEYGMTFSQVQLDGQTRVGFRNAGNEVAADGLSITETNATALLNATPTGVIVLTGGRVQASGTKTIKNAGTIVFHDVEMPASVPAPVIAQRGVARGWLQSETQWHTQTPAWRLPVPTAPTVDPGPVGDWVAVEGEPNAAPPEDATARLQAAFNSGAKTVYLRYGMFRISAPIIIPPTLHRIIGMKSTITLVPRRPAPFNLGLGFFRINEPGPPLLIDHLTMDMSNRGTQVGVELAANRTLVLRDFFGAGVTLLDRKAEGGEAYLDDTIGSKFVMTGPREVIARQLNTEGPGVRVVNHGSPLAIIGVKTENDCTVVESDSGARTQIGGGLIYMVVGSPDPSVAAFVTKDAMLSASFVEEVNVWDRHYRNFLSDTQGSQHREVDGGSMPARNLGRTVPLLWAGQPPLGE